MIYVIGLIIAAGMGIAYIGIMCTVVLCNMPLFAKLTMIGVFHIIVGIILHTMKEM